MTRIRAVLLTAENGDWVIFGANNNSDQESYNHLRAGQWQANELTDGVSFIEFDVTHKPRQIEVARVQLEDFCQNPPGTQEDQWLRNALAQDEEISKSEVEFFEELRSRCP